MIHKILCLSIACSFSVSALKAQSQWSLTGNSGTSPSANYIGTSDGQALLIKTDATERMRIAANGNVGIGTTNPLAKLHISGGDVYIMNNGQSPSFIIGDAPIASHYGGFKWDSESKNLRIGNSRSSGGNLSDMVIAPTGNIGIGTSTPNTNAKLDVSGNIFSSGKIAIGTTDMAKIADYSLVVNGEAIFNKAKVKLYTNWPDFVFEKKYELLPIAQLEKYITANKHLPDVPSAVEVTKEGIDLGSNQALLLQKIEELTLYLIEQSKKIDDQDKKIEALQKDNLLIKAKLDQPLSNK